MMSEAQLERLEAMCQRCGRCCRLKLEMNGKVILGGYCPFYSEKDHGCVCYPTRKKSNPHCKGLADAIMQGLLPEDCPYVETLPLYRTVVDEWKTRGTK